MIGEDLEFYLTRIQDKLKQVKHEIEEDNL